MSDPASIDYQPLANMQRAFVVVFKNSLHEPLGIAVLVFSAIVLPIAGVVIGLGILGIIPGAMVYVVFLVSRSNKYETGLWEAFALANGWSFDMMAPVSEVIPPSMQFGHSQKFSPIIRARLGQFDCDLFSYSTTVGEGRYAHTYSYAVICLPLPTALPHLLLLSKRTGTELQRDLENRQDVQLEGDFDDYFKLQIEQGQQIDALTVITPDVMQTLVQYNQQEDIEILGTNLYFILGLNLGQDNPDLRKVEYLIQSAVALSQQITQNLSLEQGSAVTTASLPATAI